METKQLPTKLADAKEMQKIQSRYFLYKDLICCKPEFTLQLLKNKLEYRQCPILVVVPPTLQNVVLNCYHNEPVGGGHLGTQRTYDKILLKYYWPTLHKDVEEFCRMCEGCATKRDPIPKTRMPLQPIPPATSPFQILSVDILGPFPITEEGNRYILSFVDLFSKWVEAFPTKDISAETTARIFVNEIVCRFGPPEKLLSDCGAQFKSELFNEICAKLVDTHKIFTSPYHPACNGNCERQNKVIHHMLSQYCSTSQTDWDIYLPLVLYAYRLATHESTKESPGFVLFGKDLPTPIDLSLKLPTPIYTDTVDYKLKLFYKLPKIWATVRENLIEAQAKQKRHYDQHVHLPPQYQPGDRVYYHVPFNKKGRTPKFAHQWWPFRILKIIEPNAWIVSCSNPKAPPRFVHLNHLKAASTAHMTPLRNPTNIVSENSLESAKSMDSNPLPQHLEKADFILETTQVLCRSAKEYTFQIKQVSEQRRSVDSAYKHAHVLHYRLAWPFLPSADSAATVCVSCCGHD